MSKHQNPEPRETEEAEEREARGERPSWIVCQIGAREHYAIPQALDRAGVLGHLITDFWVPPGSLISRIPGGRRLRDRWHPALTDAPVSAPNFRMLAFEARERLDKSDPWDRIIRRNVAFQHAACKILEKGNPKKTASASCRSIENPFMDRTPLQRAPHSGIVVDKPSARDGRCTTLFSYSYAALELFRFAKSRGWTTVLGQMDPGPEEERIVAEEHRRYPHLKSSWRPAPATYWDSWREEVELADRIIVNSEWSRECLLKSHVPAEKMEIIPLVYEATSPLVGSSQLVVGREEEEARDKNVESFQHSDEPVTHHSPWGRRRSSVEGQEGSISGRHPSSSPLRVLFLGQMNLRKGVGRLLEAIRMLKDIPLQLTLVGPSEIDPAAWGDLPNVSWVGPVARSQAREYYREADVFILPTLSDGFALTQLEALSHGLPVIASLRCGRVIEDGVHGLLLDSLEPTAIAEAIREFANHPTCPPRHDETPRFGLDELSKMLDRVAVGEADL